MVVQSIGQTYHKLTGIEILYSSRMIKVLVKVCSAEITMRMDREDTYIPNVSIKSS